jgi:hypothetical protein
MKKITFLSAKLIVCFLLLTSINSYGAEILDQTFALPGSATTINGTGSGQSFTAGYSGPLTKVVINIQDQAPTASSSDIRIRIIEGSGSCGSNILADQTFLNVAEFQNYEFIFTSSPTLVLGQIYTIHISTTDGSLCNIAFGSGGYSNGDFFSGISCTPFGGGTDFWFETYMSVCNITDQTVNASQSNLCDNGSVTISTGGSETGYKYYLRDNVDNSIVDGPIEGTGASLGFNTGTINTTTTYNVYTKEKMISAVDLPNNNDKIRFNTPFSSYNNEITVEAWVNFTSTSFANFPWASQSSTNDVDNMAENVWLWTPGGVATFYVNNNGTWNTINFPAMTSIGWHHIATVANPSGLFIYYDGVLVASNTNGITSTIVNNPNSIIELGQDGRYPNLVTRNSANAFDDFRVWNIARTSTEIVDNYQACLDGNEIGLVQYTRLNEATGTTVNSLQGVSGVILNGVANPWIEGSDACDGGCVLEMTELVTVTVNNSTTHSQTFEECAGFSVTVGTNTYTTTVTVGTNTYTTTGIYTDVLTNAAGCDSTVTTDLTINQPTTSSQTFEECAGFSVTVGTNTYTTTGVYTDVLTNAAGCDSTVTTDLTINQPTTSSQTFEECAGFSVTVGTNTYTTTGVYTDVLTNAAGCDSTVTTDLTINQPTTSSQTFEECAGFSVTVGTNTYSTTGVYTDVLTNASGCDSTVTTDLTITTIDNATSVTNETITADLSGATYQWLDCDNGNAPISGATSQSFTATSNGNYAVEITDNGCTETSSCVTISSASIANVDVNAQLNVYPNPTNGIVQVTLPETLFGQTILLTNTMGQVLETKIINSTMLDYNLQNLSNGIYFIQVQTENGLISKKIVKK